jgi:hypothetical protein
MKKQVKQVKKLDLTKETLRQVAGATVDVGACNERDWSYACPSRLCNPNLTD